MKQIPKCVFPSIKPKHRIAETIKWGLICIILYASLDEVFICPQSAKNLCCKWTHCLLKKKINFLQEIQEDLLRKSARRQETASIFFTSHRSTKPFFHYCYLSAARNLCLNDWNQTCCSRWRQPGWISFPESSWTSLLAYVGNFFFCVSFLILPKFGKKWVYLLNF